MQIVARRKFSVLAQAEFRIPEEHAQRFLDKDCGTIMFVGDNPFIRKVTVGVGTPLYYRIGKFDKQLKGGFFHGWNITYKYTRAELAAGEMFHLRISAVFEPAGEECGTLYGGSDGCRICGGGFEQLNELRLDLRRVPKKKDIARTIADEWIVSERLADIMAKAGLTGYELHPVKQRPFFNDAPLVLHRVPSGRVLLERAKPTGLDLNSRQFCQWLWAPEQKDLTEKAEAENLERLARRYAASIPPRPWFQLAITAQRVPMVPPSHFGINPFNDDLDGEYRCLHGAEKDHVAGLNRLSEVFVDGSAWDGSDITCTTQLVGTRRGLLRPSPLILISPRFRRLLQENNIKGFREEVVYLR